MAFIQVSHGDFHIQRRRELIRRHGDQLRKMATPNPWSFLFIISLVAVQYGTAYALKSSSAWLLVLAVFFFGAFLNHGLSVLLHEAAHNLIFRGRLWNRLAGLICDWALIVPGSMAFRKYHLIHHDRMGDYGYDADMPTMREADWVGNSAFRKTLWVFFLSVSQGSRPSRFKNVRLMDKWVAVNFLSQAMMVGLGYQLLGWKGELYLFLSTFVALGLHPLGGRWIAEHFVTREGQETYSYYGPINRIMFNIGYHTEHHDVMNVPWQQLPRLRVLAPDLYENLASYQSYTALLLEFIRNPKLTLYSRMRRDEPAFTVMRSRANGSRQNREPEIQI